MRRAFRHDTVSWPNGAKFVTAEEAEKALQGTGGDAEAARTRWLIKKGFIKENVTPAEARERMIERKQHGRDS